ncbi:MAG: Cobalt/magnesium transport protein CorA [Chlamydiia bacterium]|nr:Cobalt/magnesium transport protein CorA [Chlamydiia bacterium]MCH9615880.1 Cobalt/magnesium transport protein CorA [Chlamydiia bacterium]MCH9628717.1 Cobalt/magnesium transport protein CorA [Chlamydiia bacterium]
MITIYHKNDPEDEFNVIETPQKGCWIHVDDATTTDLNQISELIGVEYTDIYDCLDRYEIPRIERIEEHVIIFTRHPAEHESGLYTTTFAIILTNDYFITICPQKSSLVENFISQKPKLSPEQKSKFLIYILLKITQEFTLQIKMIRTNVLKQEKKMAGVDAKDITNLTMNEEILNQYLSTLIPLRSVLEAITSGRYTFLYDKDQDLLEDLLNASIQSEDLCSVNLRSIRSLRDSYQIIFTNQLNKTIKLLTGLTIILSIPTMIASLYGMNVKLPYANLPGAFGGICIVIIVSSLLSMLIFQRKKWL